MSSESSGSFRAGPSINPTAYLNQTEPAQVLAVRASVAPTTSSRRQKLSSIWIDKLTDEAWLFTRTTAGSSIWAQFIGPNGNLFQLTGDTGTAVPSNHSIALHGTSNQIVTAGSASTITWTLSPTLVLPGTLTVVGTTLINASGSAATTIGTGGTGAVSIGNATGNTSVTGSLTASTTLTATLGAITATNGNFVGTASGTGILLNSPAASGTAASPVVVNGRSGRATFTSVSIAASADLTLTLTNSSITGSTTQLVYGFRGATTGSALSIKSVTPGAGTCAFVVTNGAGATTSTADIVIDFLVLNA